MISEGAAQEVSFTFKVGRREISFDLDEKLYAIDAIYGAAYLFIDRCYVFLARPTEHVVTVRLRLKNAAGTEDLEALAGEFANELLSQVLRARIGRSTASIREYYMAKAFFSQKAESTISKLLAELDAEELEEDPLEIAVPWESRGEQGGQDQ